MHTLDRILQHVPIKPFEDVLVDFGSGKGRVLIMATRRGFRRIVGVEGSAHLNCVARNNLTAVEPHLICRNIELWKGNAADFPLPDEASILFFYDPFKGATLLNDLDGSPASHAKGPQDIWIAFNKTFYLDAIQDRYVWLETVARLQTCDECAIFRVDQNCRSTQQVTD